MPGDPRRTRVRVVALVALVGLGLALLPGGANAQERPAFVRGGANAQADTLGLNIVSGGATIGLTMGRSLARYRDRTASSEGRALDLGAMSVLFGDLSRCDEQIPILPKESLPPITAADSTDPASPNPRRTEAFFPGLHGVPSVLPAGFQDATATTQPASRATTETPYQDISFFSLTNARTETTAQLDGERREARAVVTADELTLMNGMFRFVKPRWDAVSTSGATESQLGSFTFEAASVWGIARTRDQMLADVANFGTGLSSLLGGLGVRIDLPQVVVEGRRVRVTPMAFRITDPPLGAAALMPFFNNIQPLYDMMAENLKKEDCNNAVPLQLVDVVLQVLKGSGSITIPVGGVEVTTDDRYFAPLQLPPSDGGAPDDVVEPVPTLPEVPAVVRSTPSSSRSVSSYVPPPDTTPPVEVESDVTVPPEEPTGDDEVAGGIDVPMPPAAISSRFEDGKKGGTATVVGICALLAVLGLAGADRWAMRRNQRRIE